MAGRKVLFSEINTDMFTATLAEAAFPTADHATVVFQEVKRSLNKVHAWVSALGCSIAGEWGDPVAALRFVSTVFSMYIADQYQVWCEVYAGLTRLTLTPAEDITVRDRTHKGSDGAMSENSPISNGFDIDTPFVKSKGVSEYQTTERETNDTVHETVQRIQAIERFKCTIFDTVKSGVLASCDEALTAL